MPKTGLVNSKNYNVSVLMNYSKSQRGAADDGAPMVEKVHRAEIGSPHDFKSFTRCATFPLAHDM